MGGAMPMNKLSRETGLSMIEVIVALSIILIAVFFGLKLFNNTASLSSTVTHRMDLVGIAGTVDTRTDCEVIPPNCSKNSLIGLRTKKTGAELISSSGKTKMAGWTVRAQCRDNNEFVVQVAKLDPSGRPIKDSLTKQLLDFDHPKNMLFAEGMLCPLKVKTVPAVSANTVTVKLGASCYAYSPDKVPCNPPPPPECGTNQVSIGRTLDTFGGKSDGVNRPEVYGQTWKNYCRPK